MLHLIFKLGLCAQNCWRCMRGFRQLDKLIRGMQFQDTVEITELNQDKKMLDDPYVRPSYITFGNISVRTRCTRTDKGLHQTQNNYTECFVDNELCYSTDHVGL